jgi:hypothetical protein
MKQDLHAMQCMSCFTLNALARKPEEENSTFSSNFWPEPEEVGSKYCKMTCHKMEHKICHARLDFLCCVLVVVIFIHSTLFRSAARCFRRSIRYLLIGGELKEIAEVHSERGGVWNLLF